MTPLVRYLWNDILPEERNEARKIKKQDARYCISPEKLYRSSFSGLYLRCVTPRESARILVELHEGDCGSHSSGISLVLRVWLLLAHDGHRRQQTGQALRPMPKARSSLQAPPGEPQVHKLTMALQKVGHGYSREISYGTGAEGLPSDSH